MSLVSVVIPVFNQADYTRRCLESLARVRASDPDREILVVDNGSTDSTQELLRGECERDRELRVLRSEKNEGFSRGCNLGAAQARGPWILFLNNDTEVVPGWLTPLVEVLQEDPEVVAVGSRLLFPDGKLQHAGVLIANVEGRDPLFAFHPFERERADHPVAMQRRTYQALTAACLLVRRDAFDAVGGFDEGYWNGYEDVDLCFKLRERGGILVYEPRSVVIHHTSKSGPERWKAKSENIRRLHSRWLGKVMPDLTVDRAGNARDNQAGAVAPYRVAAAR
ncbi:MAG: glycosyltransferase family 2 protein [Planctomycetes bacterium]|nr:glycosyltransferase family 2 protein [Planctomycetota bacterium]